MMYLYTWVDLNRMSTNMGSILEIKWKSADLMSPVANACRRSLS